MAFASTDDLKWLQEEWRALQSRVAQWGEQWPAHWKSFEPAARDLSQKIVAEAEIALKPLLDQFEPNRHSPRPLAGNLSTLNGHIDPLPVRRCEKFVGPASRRPGPSRFPSRLAPGLRLAGATKLFFLQLLTAGGDRFPVVIPKPSFWSRIWTYLNEPAFEFPAQSK